MKKVILVRYGEIMLKGLNRPAFEDRLIRNIKRSLNGLGKTTVSRSQARIYIEPEQDDFDFESAVSRLVRVFGIVSVSIVWKVESDFETIKKHSAEMVRDYVAKLGGSAAAGRESGQANAGGKVSFKVESKRGNKRFPLESPEISRQLGGYLLKNVPGLKVDVNDPDFLFFVEVREYTYIYCDIIPAFGGLPVGTSGKGMLLLSGGIDSPVAGWMMAKRGMEIEAVHFHTYPYTSERAKDKVISLAKILSQYCQRIRLHIVPFTEIQLEINDKCPAEYLTIIMRRAMMRIAERIAAQNGAIALITGESLGQVASQTAEAIAVTNNAVSMPVFRPLIGMDKNEVVEIARKIDTYETSILPYEDCCTVFVAKHPKTKPKLEEAKEYESRLDLEELIGRAVRDTETLDIGD
ncbi:MAG TPA: tRNA uracil 4-sulfurtransferase ThiI [Clostridiales bacterium]|nr:tRNA uracil 4-sulfurtransferase ThiI [Clostridiales bacterium]